MKFQRYDLPYSAYENFRGICPEPSWKVVPACEFSDVFSIELVSKVNDVVVIASGTNNYSVFLVNLLRVDIPDLAIDQEPYIVVFDHNKEMCAGGFIHHGNWEGRTVYPDPEFFYIVTASGIPQHYPYLGLPTTSSGELDELKIDSHDRAFWTAFSGLKNNTGWEVP